ncbi:MAG: hypothetical protein NTZ99_07060 [Burkholderiales bacterium]|jgi:hypothetical protein|nr:hypothetical protein [Burkholderiales bacterium]
MKKIPGVNGDWIPVTREERMEGVGLPTAITLGTPLAVHTALAIDPHQGKLTWLAVLCFWMYGFLFWVTAIATQMFRRKRWEWTPEALEEQRMFDPHIDSKAFWAHWWVRFPIGLLFMSIGMYAFLLDDFILQWISVLFLLLGFVIPFVFMVELALLPLSMVVVLALLGVVELLPLPLIVMFSIAGMLVIVVVAQKQSAMLPKKIKKIKKPETAKTPTAEATAPAAAAATETAEAAGDAAVSSEAPSENAGEEQAADAASAEANKEKEEEKNEETEKKS